MRTTFRITFLVAILLLLVGKSTGQLRKAHRRLQTTSVFVNEFHYDNQGTDVNEFIEIAFPADMPQSQVEAHKLLLYNGKNGRRYRRFYMTSDATFTPDFGAVPSNGIRLAVVNTDTFQNGGRDGDAIAIVDGSGNLVQFICYENSVTATNGEAAGAQCPTPISERETSSTPLSNSLQLTGTGCVYEDFTWQTPKPESPGGTNSGQTFTCSVTTMPPSASPSSFPSDSPSLAPSSSPSREPSSYPSSGPTLSLAPSSGPSPPPVDDTRTEDDICPQGRLDPPLKYEIQPYPDTVTGDGVDDDLNEISYIAFSEQMSPDGKRYAYTASDKEQFSLKVLEFSDNIMGGSGVTVATYKLDVELNENGDYDDWEAISLGPCTDSNSGSGVYTVDQTCIYIGNIGNNRDPKRDVLKIFKFVEPQIDTVSPQSIINPPLSVTTIKYEYDTSGGFSSNTLDAEGMFVDWVGIDGSNDEKKGDIYILTKNDINRCDAGVGKIPVSVHKDVSPGVTTSLYPVPNVTATPKQGADLDCLDGPFRAWTGADMRRDGRLIALIRQGAPASVHFFPRLATESVIDALSGDPCPYVSPTSVGLTNEKKHEAVAFVDVDGVQLADISECEGSCSPNLYVYDLLYAGSNYQRIDEPEEGWTQITFDDFSSGRGSYIFDAAYASVGGSSICGGSNTAAKIWDDKGAASSFEHEYDQACQSFDLLRVSFEFQFAGYDALDTFFLECSLESNTNYHIIGAWTRGVDGYEEANFCHQGKAVVFPELFNVAGFGNEVRLRFRSSANSDTDSVFVYNILFEGYSETANAPSETAAPSSAPSNMPSTSSAPAPPPIGDNRTDDDICPEKRLNPPKKYEIEEYGDTVGGDGVDDSLNGIALIAFSDQTSPEGNRYAYAASDNKQSSLKVIEFSDNIMGGNGTTVAKYTLGGTFTSEDDWEAISLGPCTDSNVGSVYTVDQTCIYIGNIGNNNQGRTNFTIYKFVEPLIDTASPQSFASPPLDVATIEYTYETTEGFSSNALDAEGMFVDWVGIDGSNDEKKGDIYILTKNDINRCDGGVGKIPVSVHKNIPPGGTTSTYPMPKVSDLPLQGADLDCSQGPYRSWTGADMRRDGRLIALIRKGSPASVHFFPRVATESVANVFNNTIPCPYASPTSVGLTNEKKHKAVAFVDVDGNQFADISECEVSCSPNLYVYDLVYPDSNYQPIQDPGIGWTQITFDNFQSGFGNYASGGGFASVGGASTCDGSSTAAKIWDDNGVGSSFYHGSDQACDTFNLLRVSFQFRFVGYDALDTLFLECSLEGDINYHIVGSWTRGVDGFDADNFCHEGALLISPAMFNAPGFGNSVRLRFRSSANSSGDSVFVYNILFEGTSESAASS